MEGEVCDRLAILIVLKSVNERGEFVLWRKNQKWLELDGWLVKYPFGNVVRSTIAKRVAFFLFG